MMPVLTAKPWIQHSRGERNSWNAGLQLGTSESGIPQRLFIAARLRLASAY
jgi:hypothetical protein